MVTCPYVLTRSYHSSEESSCNSQRSILHHHAYDHILDTLLANTQLILLTRNVNLEATSLVISDLCRKYELVQGATRSIN